MQVGGSEKEGCASCIPFPNVLLSPVFMLEQRICAWDVIVTFAQDTQVATSFPAPAPQDLNDLRYPTTEL
jgi:hypothetical protein